MDGTTLRFADDLRHNLVGLPWLHTWGSGRFSGIARDAEYLADLVVAPRVLAALGRA